MRRVLEPLGVAVLPRPLDVPDVEETEETLEGNALLKARALTAATGEAAVADDTGLFIDALDGRPGVYSARYAGKGASYADNVRKALQELDGVEAERRSARFRSVIAVTYPSGESWWVEGVLEGTIRSAPQGEGGFGYDCIFEPVGGSGVTLAELSPDAKSAISHRGLALRAFAKKVKSS
jgi:XTP/dITP diphosphohydrolase